MCWCGVVEQRGFRVRDILSLTPEAQIPKVVEDAADIELIR